MTNEMDMYYVDCEREEREQREREMEARRKFVEGMKRYPEKGIPVYIDGKIAEEQNDWDKLTVIREDEQFYMADFVEDEVQGRLKEVRFDMVYHGGLESENSGKRRRIRKRR